MAQIKIYGSKTFLSGVRQALSDAIHQAVVTSLEYPEEKRFHRFISLDKEDFIYPADRSEAYIIIEISMFAGRQTETKKQLIRAIYQNLKSQCGIAEIDIEITIFEEPKENWGIRGLPGDELALGYKVEV